MEIGQKILDTIYKYNKSAYGASSECIEVVYDDDYNDLKDELAKLFSLHNVSNMLTVKEVLDILDDSDHLDDAKTLIRETVS